MLTVAFNLPISKEDSDGFLQLIEDYEACFYINRGSICACFNKDFKAELLKGLEKEGVTYIKLETVKVKMGDDFVDEEILSFYTDDTNTHEKLQTFLDIFDDAVNKYESDLKQKEKS